jgi:hypothetical protein
MGGTVSTNKFNSALSNSLRIVLEILRVASELKSAAAAPVRLEKRARYKFEAAS